MKKLLFFLFIPYIYPSFSQTFLLQKNNVLYNNCNNWLQTPSQPSYVDIGNLNITGNKITIEATINRTSYYSNGVITDGDIVSKHSNPADANYILRPTRALITTSNGFFYTPNVCDLQLNKTYHIAMVYDGVTLKFYRNGFLMSQVPATGNLVQNSWNTRIAFFAPQNSAENFVGFINEVRIWNIARTQTEIRAYMNSSLPNPTGQLGLQAYYIFDNLLNKQGNAAWNGSIGGSAVINATNPNCTFVADSCGALINCNSDFFYKQNICNPLSIQFFDAGINTANQYWSFGDGISSVTPNPVHIYTAPGNYTVKYSLQNGCTDTISKTVSVNISSENIITTPDTTICYGSTKQLRTLPALNFCWTPTTYLNDPNSANPITSTKEKITYYFNAEITGTNLIVNGDFNNGNTGFTSEYNYATPNITEGQYFVGSSPQAWNASLSNCKDHTTGTGNMLLVNGSPTSDVNIWKQTITVIPNTNYAFSTWIQALWPPNPAQLQFSINGKTLGNLITASLPTCTWTQFYTTWNSGNNTSAIISIVNKNTEIQGNDFALDDISFAPVFIKRDSVIVTVDSPSVKTNNDTTVCLGSQIQLNTIGASAYSWSPTTGLSDPNIANPIVTINNFSTYIVSGINANGCIAKDTIIITTFSKPLITKNNDTVLCKETSIQLYVTGGVSYLWSPVTGLSNPNIANPIASPVATTTYFVTVTDGNACAYKDSIKITIKSSALFSVSPDQNVCAKNSKQLIASGGNSYLWHPSTYLDNPNIANPLSTPDVTTIYRVKIKDSTCNDSTILTTTLMVLPLPLIRASKTNDIDCSNNFSQLNAAGGKNYFWQPGKYLNDSTISNPIAKPLATTSFIVNGIDINGCKNTDTITVKVGSGNKGGYYMSNAFTPNRDGVNDCFGLKYWGNVTELDFSIYNRFGEKIFHTTDPAKCWDGTYKGRLQNIGMYVYVIKATTSCDIVSRKGTFILLK